MKKMTLSRAILVFTVFIFSCEQEINNPPVEPPDGIDLTNSIYYEINLDDRSDDTFKVRMFVDNLTQDNAVIQFPATAPGTYDIHDIGRFVVKLKAYDEDLKELTVSHPNTNQWILVDPDKTRIIEYEVQETFDTPVSEYQIYKMAGTTLEKSHTLLNTFDVICYPTGLKEHDYYLNIDYPSSWSVGTSLLKNETGFYHATDYDKLVDNPLLLGNITHASTTVSGAEVSVYAYSKNNLIQSSQVLDDMNSVLQDATEFLNGLPVDRYSFIYLFDEFNAGALEHSYSSVYVLADLPYTVNYSTFLRDIAAHEFFHVVTPLNIHSEIIGDFNFAEPTASEHLWLYEGVTEWASEIMQFRNGHMAMTTLFDRFEAKKSNADYYNSLGAMSLSYMSLNCYEDGGAQFGNVYNKGALVAALLDIRLLELSGGTKGLREVILELIETYGPENAFSEVNFFTDLADITGYPVEINDFLNKYIKGTDALPLAEYFDKIGITYTAAGNTFSVNAGATAGQIALREKWSVNL